MTLEEFDNAKWHKGMICYNNRRETLKITGIDFLHETIVAMDAGVTTHYHFSEIKLEEKNKQMVLFEKCNECSSCRSMPTQNGWRYFGCFYGDNYGKWIAKIIKCPKEEEA